MGFADNELGIVRQESPVSLTLHVTQLVTAAVLNSGGSRNKNIYIHSKTNSYAEMQIKRNGEMFDNKDRQSFCLEGKGGGVQTEEYHPNCEARGKQHHVVGYENRWHHGTGRLCGCIEARKVKLAHKRVLQTRNYPKRSFKAVVKSMTTKSRYYTILK